MEHVIGGYAPRYRFDRYLAGWERILDQRVDQAVETIGGIRGVCGLVLAGSIGRGNQWPLSDIDLIPVLDVNRVDEARAEIERHRLVLIEQWLPEGWWTGVDIGRLYFTDQELVEIFPMTPKRISALLADERWYHSLDKGYGGRPVLDPDGLAAQLVQTFNDARFAQPTVALRLQRAAQAAESARQLLARGLERENLFGATAALHDAVKWYRTWQLEEWHESDVSLGRVGTRFERLARARGRDDLVQAIREASGLSDASVRMLMRRAPDWVHERHDRSWAARQAVGEELSKLDDARDVLRVCAQYQMRAGADAPHPEWLGVPREAGCLQRRTQRLDALLSSTQLARENRRSCTVEL